MNRDQLIAALQALADNADQSGDEEILRIGQAIWCLANTMEYHHIHFVAFTTAPHPWQKDEEVRTITMHTKRGNHDLR